MNVKQGKVTGGTWFTTQLLQVWVTQSKCIAAEAGVLQHVKVNCTAAWVVSVCTTCALGTQLDFCQGKDDLCHPQQPFGHFHHSSR